MKIKKGEDIEVEIHDLAFGGKGISRVETEEGGKFVIFVTNTIPGQIVKARIMKKRKKHAECSLLEVIKH